MTSGEYAKLTDSLTEDEALFLCDVINNLSEGGHPVAELRNLRYFEMPYVLERLDLALVRLTERGQQLAAVVRQKLTAE